MNLGMASHIPASAPANAVGGSVSVALQAKPSPEQLQQFRVGRTVRPVAGQASLGKSTYIGIVLYPERTFYFCMAAQAGILTKGFQSSTDTIGAMGVVTIRAGNTSLQHRMVRVGAEFGILFLMTGNAQCGLILLQEEFSRGWFVQIMAFATGDVVLPVGGSCPFENLRGGTMTGQASVDHPV